MQNIFTTTDFHGASVYEIVQLAPARFGARFLSYLPDVPLTPDELAEQASEEAEWQAMIEQFGYPEGDEFSQHGLFTTEAAARRAVELCNAMSFAHDDCRMYNAPQECVRDATRSMQRELEALEREFGVSSTTDETVRELQHQRDMPAWQALGFRETDRPDDDAVLRAMGERSALQ